MWVGFPHTDVLLAHAALLWRSSSFCCPHSRHLHSSHSCRQSFESSSLSLSAGICFSLSLSAQAFLALLPRDKMKQERGQLREEEGALPVEDKREERSEGKTDPAGLFVWDTLDFYRHCVVSISSLYSLAPSLNTNNSAVTILHFSKQRRKHTIGAMLISFMPRCRCEVMLTDIGLIIN